jgi:hypothetical protein
MGNEARAENRIRTETTAPPEPQTFFRHRKGGIEDIRRCVWSRIIRCCTNDSSEAAEAGTGYKQQRKMEHGVIIGSSSITKDELYQQNKRMAIEAIGRKGKALGVSVTATPNDLAKEGIGKNQAEERTNEQLKKEYNQEQYIRRRFNRKHRKHISEIEGRLKNGLPVDEKKIIQGARIFQGCRR